MNENANARELSKLQIGQIVRVQNQTTKTWERKAKIVGICEFNRSYELENMSDGKLFRRNRKLIKPVADRQNEGQKCADIETDKESVISERKRPNKSADTGLKPARRSNKSLEKAERESNQL